MSGITILLADDHVVLRHTLKDHLERQEDMTVVAEVSNADDAVTESVRLKPDVALLDIDMPGRYSFDAARTIKTNCPDTRVVFLSAFSHDRYIDQAFEAEASGYITKSEPPEKTVEAIRRVMSGASYYSPEVEMRTLIDTDNRLKVADAKATRIRNLTPREMEVLRHLARGLSKKEIAQIMQLSVSTVDHHCTKLMAKLAIHDRVQLALYAIREGLAEP